MSLGHKHYAGFCFEYYAHFINSDKRNTMEHIRFRAWDTIENQFFKPVYQRQTVDKAKIYISELLLTQSGEIMHRVTENDQTKITHEMAMEFKNRFKINLRAGVKDCEGKKYYFNDIVHIKWAQAIEISKGRKVMSDREQTGVLIWNGDSFAIGVGPIDDYKEIITVSKEDLQASEIIGNIYMNRKIIMGDESKCTECSKFIPISDGAICKPCLNNPIKQLTNKGTTE